MDQWTNGPMVKWTNGLKVQWSNRPFEQSTNALQWSNERTAPDWDGIGMGYIMSTGIGFFLKWTFDCSLFWV